MSRTPNTPKIGPIIPEFKIVELWIIKDIVTPIPINKPAIKLD